jgi:hypothetical protein
LPRTCRGATVSRSDTGTAQLLAAERRTHMETLLVFHEVDDVDHWLASPKREEFFGPLGMSVRTFRDPAGSNRVGLIVEVPDIAAWEQALQTEAAAEAMKYDGVRPETILGLVEA